MSPLRTSPDLPFTGSELENDSNASGFVIRIPNPKIYMARHNLTHWKGQRGKPRCDHCRINNLKCDREHPACNHCQYSSAGQPCLYTPLPTPAHRGIPRCDRCRRKNFKCDRVLPMCNLCSDHSDAECNYTPKRRHKIPAETFRTGALGAYSNKKVSFLVDDMPPAEDSPFIAGQLNTESSLAHVSSSPLSFKRTDATSSLYALDALTESDCLKYATDGQYTPNFQRWNSTPSTSPTRKTQTNNFSFVNHSFPTDQGVTASKSFVEPWHHSSFASLPDDVLKRLRTVKSIEMPNRYIFDRSLCDFLAGLSSELRETAAFTPEIYAEMSVSVAKQDMSKFSSGLQMWLSHHHIRSGSNVYFLLLVPRDAYFQMETAEEERLRMEYVSCVDGTVKDITQHPIVNGAVEYDQGALVSTQAFERIPVQTQIYDVLAYAHRVHGNASSMFFETRRIGMAFITIPMVELFIRMCPLCTIKRKSVGAVGVFKPEKDAQIGIYNPRA